MFFQNYSRTVFINHAKYSRKVLICFCNRNHIIIIFLKCKLFIITTFFKSMSFPYMRCFSWKSRRMNTSFSCFLKLLACVLWLLLTSMRMFRKTYGNTHSGLIHELGLATFAFGFAVSEVLSLTEHASQLLLINIHVANIIPKIAFILIVFLNYTSDSFAYRMFIRSRLWSAIQSIWINNPISSVVINTTPLMRPFIVIYMLIIKA